MIDCNKMGDLIICNLLIHIFTLGLEIYEILSKECLSRPKTGRTSLKRKLLSLEKNYVLQKNEVNFIL